MKEEFLDKTMAAVHERLAKEMAYWDRRANELKEQEMEARQRADDLDARLQTLLERERELAKLKVTVTLTPEIIRWIDDQIKRARFEDRSHAVQFSLLKVKTIKPN